MLGIVLPVSICMFNSVPWEGGGGGPKSDMDIAVTLSSGLWLKMHGTISY
jgi:hypothetical protein